MGLRVLLVVSLCGCAPSRGGRRVALPAVPVAVEVPRLEWHDESLVGDDAVELYGVAGRSASDVFVVGAELGADRGRIFHSGDRGASWTTVPGDFTRSLYGAWASAAKDVYVVGAQGTILHARDGARFAAEVSGTDAWLYGVWGSGPDDVYAVGGNSYGFGEDAHDQPQGDLPGVILHSIDGGRSWSRTIVGDAPVVCVWGSGADDVFAAEGTAILHSKDRGRTWQRVDAGHIAYGLWGGRDGARFAANLDGTISRSSDAGATWVATPVVDRYAYGAWLRGVFGRGAREVYVVGDKGTIVHSADGGGTWSFDDSGTAKDLRSVGGASADDLYAVGAGGTILHLRPSTAGSVRSPSLRTSGVARAARDP